MRPYIIHWNRDARTKCGEQERFTTEEAARDFMRDLREHHQGVWYIRLSHQQSPSHHAVKLDSWCRSYGEER